MDQMDLFAARSARDEAMARVEEHADVDWKVAARRAVLDAARVLPRLTSDDVMDRISGVSTHELRALGPIMLAAAKNGWIAKADCAAVLCRRSSRHAAPLTVWRSLILEAAAA
jgi:hypothetical protein